MIVPAPGEAASLALALVNTRRRSADGTVDDVATAAALVTWAAGHGLDPTARVDAAALNAMRALRADVRELLLARIEARTPDPGAVDAVNAASAAAPTAPALSWSAPDAPLERRDCLGADGVALARALIAADAIGLVTGPRHADLRACAAPNCVRLLLKDHPQRQWCSTRCGDRVRAHRYYHRHKASA